MRSTITRGRRSLSLPGHPAPPCPAALRAHEGKAPVLVYFALGRLVLRSSAYQPWHLPREGGQTAAVSIATGEEEKEKAIPVNGCQIAFCLCLAAVGFSLI